MFIVLHFFFSFPIISLFQLYISLTLFLTLTFKKSFFHPPPLFKTKSFNASLLADIDEEILQDIRTDR